MTIDSIISWLNTHQTIVFYYYGLALLLAIITVFLVNEKSVSTIKYIMSFLVYGVTIPAVLSFFLLLYNILFLKTNILKLGVAPYFIPILAMVIIILIMNRKIKMTKLPGFTRLSSLIVIIGMSFLLLFVLQRSYFGVFFLGSFTNLILFFAVIMIVLRFAWNKLIK